MGERDQLDRIFRHLGTPTREIFPSIVDLPEFQKNNFRQYPLLTDLQSLVPILDPLGVDLLSKMLTFDPAKRISAREAMNHPFFLSSGNNDRQKTNIVSTLSPGLNLLQDPTTSSSNNQGHLMVHSSTSGDSSLPQTIMDGQNECVTSSTSAQGLNIMPIN